MTHLTLIVAFDSQRGIGLNNDLPWRLAGDLTHFKQVTMGSPIIMGRRTFDSIGRALPGRRNIVITRDPNWKAARGPVEVVSSVQEAVELVGDTPAFVIGGGQIYAEFLSKSLIDQIIATQIKGIFDCDTFFPDISEGWAPVSSRYVTDDDYNYGIHTYRRSCAPFVPAPCAPQPDKPAMEPVTIEPVQVKSGSYDPNLMLDEIMRRLQLKNDAALARLASLGPATISKIRHGRAPISASILIRFHEAFGISINEMRSLMGDRRTQFRLQNGSPWSEEKRMVHTD